MSKTFFEIPRREHFYRPVAQRLGDPREVEATVPLPEVQSLAKRCQNCGLPFCHAMGCPLMNHIPEMNRAVVHGDWRDAWERLAETSPFPEFTSRVCPALCENACCLGGLDFGSTNVRQVEKAVVETAFARGWVTPSIPVHRTGHKIAVIGAGPAGLAAAVALNDAGHEVTLFDRNRQVGGLLRYGIPCFKLDKAVVERRWKVLEASGIHFQGGAEIGKDISGAYLLKHFDAVVVANGTPIPRDLKVPGRELPQVYQALDYLGDQNRATTGESDHTAISAAGKRVLVIGGGDTGSDCAGTALRQGAQSALSIDVMPMPPEHRSPKTPWPAWPYQLRSSYAVEEGMQRFWSLNTLRILEHDGQVAGAEVVPVEWEFSPEGRPMKFVPAGPSHIIACDMVVLAMGFLKRTRAQVLESLGLPDQSNVVLCGDAASGPSLVVRAIADGLKCARQLDEL
jgi:glutamate synthase (NADPH) small chain